MKSKQTVEKAEAVLKGALKAEEARLVKEEQQEVEAKQALQERIRTAAEKNTPGAVSDMEQHDCGPRGVRPLDCARFPRWDVAAAHPPTPDGLETVTIAAAPSAPPPAGPPPEHSAK